MNLAEFVCVPSQVAELVWMIQVSDRFIQGGHSRWVVGMRAVCTFYSSSTRDQLLIDISPKKPKKEAFRKGFEGCGFNSSPTLVELKWNAHGGPIDNARRENG